MAHVTWLDSGNVDWGYHGPGWYFWDEAWSYGPYPTRNKAIFEQTKYCCEVLGIDCDWVFIDEEVELP